MVLAILTELCRANLSDASAGLRCESLIHTAKPPPYTFALLAFTPSAPKPMHTFRPATHTFCADRPCERLTPIAAVPWSLLTYLGGVIGVHEGYALHLVDSAGDYMGLARAGDPYVGLPYQAMATEAAEAAAATDGSLRLLRQAPGGCLQRNYLANASAGFASAPPAPPLCNWSASAQPWYPAEIALAACDFSGTGAYSRSCLSTAYAVVDGAAVALHAPLRLPNGTLSRLAVLEIAISPVEKVTVA